MKKKLSIVGRGTVGCLSLPYFLYHTDWDIDWVYNPYIPTTSVGEGTTQTVPKLLHQTMHWNNQHLRDIGGTVKQGIYKKYWGGNGDYFHPFSLENMGVHFSAVDLQSKIFDELKDNKRVNLVEQNVSDPENLDSDFVMVCAGSPKESELFDEKFDEKESIVLNSCYVTQCFWEHSAFQHTLTIARPYGWVFGIPLQNRCSIGYLFNRNINTLEEVKKDVLNVFEEFNLQPSDTTNYLEFKSYSRKNNFSDKVIHNGNDSFFLEPLEATSTGMAEVVNKIAVDKWHGQLPNNICQQIYNNELNGIEAMINLHYLSGSVWDNEFWNNAKQRATKRFNELLSSNNELRHILYEALYTDNHSFLEYGTWGVFNWRMNIHNLGLTNTLKELLEETKK